MFYNFQSPYGWLGHSSSIMIVFCANTGRLGKLRLKIEGEGGGMAIFSALAHFQGLCVVSLTGNAIARGRVLYWGNKVNLGERRCPAESMVFSGALNSQPIGTYLGTRRPLRTSLSWMWSAFYREYFLRLESSSEILPIWILIWIPTGESHPRLKRGSYIKILRI